MCGICGIVGRDDVALVGAMSSLIAHRGPDGEGVCSFPGVGSRPPATLGHRRLSIIDLSERGAQPMSFGGGRYWITYNGELYNFRSLRAELQGKGHQFVSDSDTEVMVALYAEHGSEMLGRLNGIFAFAIWDAERGELFIARDRLGVKPLYYAAQEGWFAFASEVKALLPVLPQVRLRDDVLGDYLTFLWVPEPDTMFKGVHKLPAGHYGTYASGTLSVREYWDLRFTPERRAPKEWADLVREGVKDAVHRQLVSDVPVGAFLSGGLDSSAIVSQMAETAASVPTYTIGYSKRDLRYDIVPDDVVYARRVAQIFGLDYHEQILSPDLVDLLPRIVWQMDEPVADPAAISTMVICAAASEHMTVILSGMGGDEVFAGYPRYLAARLGFAADFLPLSARAWLRRQVEQRLTIGGPGRLRGPRRNLAKLARGIDAPPHERYLVYSSYYRRDELARLLMPDVSAGIRDPFAAHRSHLERVRGEHWLNQLLYLDTKTFLPCLNLMYTDKMSMAASTEVRVPLLDDELVALASRIPPELKLRRLTRKYVLKKSMESVLPRDIVWRSKAGFGAPVRAWLVNELAPLTDELLSPAAVASRGLFNPTEVARLRRDNAEGVADNSLRIWALLTLELWLRQYVDGAGSYKAQTGVPPRFKRVEVAGA